MVLSKYTSFPFPYVHKYCASECLHIIIRMLQKAKAMLQTSLSKWSNLNAHAERDEKLIIVIKGWKNRAICKVKRR